MARGEDRGRSNRRWLVATLFMGVLAIGVRVAAETRNGAAGVLAGAAMVAFVGVLVVVTQRRSRQRAASYGPLETELMLDFDCLPAEWPELARETLPAAADNVPGLGVILEARHGWLRIDKRRVLGTGRHPFSARVPLAAVRDVWADKSFLGLVGSSLVLELDNGAEIRGDVMASLAECEAKADRFRAAVAEARQLPAPGPLFLQVTSPPPPPRTPPTQAWVLMMATFVPFAVAMAGAERGLFAAIGTTGTLFLALGLQMRRRLSMPITLAKAHGVAALGFAVDAAMTGQPLRLVGTAICIALIAWMTGLRAPGRAPGPA